MRVRCLASQDSSLIATLARADCLIVRPSFAPALAEGEEVEVMRLEE
jgi:molybdopterin molybdotransferase